MKSLKLRLLLLTIATVLTLMLSHAVAEAACANIEFGGTVYGDYECKLVTFCGGWCYYECKCTNLFPGYTCDDVLTKAGFESVDAISCSE
jgi:hypothetical protein